jgi:hypothetical protein
MKFEGKVLSFELDGKKYELDSKGDFVKSHKIVFPYNPKSSEFTLIIQKNIKEHKHQEFIDAHKSGKKIQFRFGNTEVWKDIDEPMFLPDVMYRIKPETVDGYRCGDRFMVDAYECILAQVLARKFALIDLRSGNRHDDPIKLTYIKDTTHLSLESIYRLSWCAVTPISKPRIIEL